MKQISQSYKTGELKIAEVAEPRARAGSVLVNTTASLLSAGTERTIVELGRKSLLGKAKERPDLVAKVIDKARKEGPLAAFEAVMTRLDSPIPLGYSLAGRLSELGAGVTDFALGDRVACAGAGFANHAEMNVVPRNLVARIPDTVSDEEAAFVTIGAIALHGARLLSPALGETVVIIGLGLLGQIAVQLLTSQGCDVVGVDVDPARVELALARGARAGATIGRDDPIEVVRANSRGRGADGVLITASSADAGPIALAGDLARDRATVSVVGLMPLEIPRKAYYEKELQVVVSRSYGPGRYDPAYEERGHDYPIGYVRWTQQRNMEAVLSAIESKRLDVSSLITHRFEFERALDAYALITGQVSEPHLGVVLTYPQRIASVPAEGRPVASSKARLADKLGVGVVGTGAFATSVLLPALSRVPDAHMVVMASSRGLSAKHAADRYSAEVAPGIDEVLARPDVQVVVIATRHSTHARLAEQALDAGRDVFLEKPAAVTPAELSELARAVHKSEARIMVGFNRRFAPFARDVKAAFSGRRAGLVMSARINAGHVPAASWVADRGESGGRIVGEACHFVDLLSYWAGAHPVRVSAHAVGEVGGFARADNVIIVLDFADGSVGSISYCSMGDASVGKEAYELFSEGTVVRIDDWRTLAITRRGKTKTHRALRADKGHSEELRAFVDACRRHAPSPIAWESIEATTRATFAAELAWQSQASVTLD